MDTMSSTIEDTNPTDAQLVALAEKLFARCSKSHSYSAFIIDNVCTGVTRYLRTWSGAGAVQEAMVALGYDFYARAEIGFGAYVSFYGTQPDQRTNASAAAATLPDAILLAACAALGVDA